MIKQRFARDRTPARDKAEVWPFANKGLPVIKHKFARDRTPGRDKAEVCP